MNSKELLEALIKVVGEHGQGKSILLAVADADGLSTSIKLARALEDDNPGHMERMLVILSGVYYGRYIEEASGASMYVLDSRGNPSNGRVQ